MHMRQNLWVEWFVRKSENTKITMIPIFNRANIQHKRVNTANVIKWLHCIPRNND